MREIDTYETELADLESRFFEDRTKYEEAFIKRLSDYVVELVNRKAFFHFHREVDPYDILSELYLTDLKASEPKPADKSFYRMITNARERCLDRNSVHAKELHESVSTASMNTFDEEEIEKQESTEDLALKFFAKGVNLESDEFRIIYRMAICLFLYGHVFPHSEISSRARMKHEIDRFVLEYGEGSKEFIERLRGQFKTHRKRSGQFNVTSVSMSYVVYSTWHFGRVFFQINESTDDVELVLRAASILFSYDAKKIGSSEKTNKDHVNSFFRWVVQNIGKFPTAKGKAIDVDDLHALRSRFIKHMDLFESYVKHQDQMNDTLFRTNYEAEKVGSSRAAETTDQYINDAQIYDEQFNNAPDAFYLRYNDKAAIPQLLNFLNGKYDDIVKLRAINAIGKLGREGISLIPLLENHQESWKFNGTLPAVTIQESVDLALKKLRACVN